MSGIVGFFSEKETVDSIGVLKRMLTQIKHRGLDYNGVFISDQVGLGVTRRRLISGIVTSIPLGNEEESEWIVWSGKIFNHEDLKAKLLALGHMFKTKCDDELMLHLYREYGKDCLTMINGQFAFSIWNAAKNELFLARDRVGICPLYYSHTANGFVFASEIKALFEYPQISPAISAETLVQIITFWSPISPASIFQGIYELSPGHYLTLNSNGIKSGIYWNYPVFRPDEYSNLSLTESIDQLDHLLGDAVAIRTQTEEPLGAYLSGGIDSSVTTAYIKELYPDQNLDTFSINFENTEFDETLFQQLAVDFFKTNHSRVICSDGDIVNNFKRMVWHAETPLLRTAPVPMLLLSNLARRSNIKTIISGEGADELVGGYNIFKEAAIREFWAKEPNSKYRPLLLKKLYPYLSQMENTNELALKMFFGYKLTETSSPVYSHILRWQNTSRIRKFFSSRLSALTKDYQPIEEFTEKIKSKLEGVDLLSRAQWLEGTVFMPGHLLSSQGERMAIANSVEARYPFLDHRVIEFCMKLKPEYKLKGLNEKYILKTMMKDRMPHEIIMRQKQPYRAPISTSFTPGYSGSYIYDMLSNQKLDTTGYFNPKIVKQLLERIKGTTRIREMDNMALSLMLSTQILHFCFVEKSIPMVTDSELITLNNVVYDKEFKYA